MADRRYFNATYNITSQLNLESYIEYDDGEICELEDIDDIDDGYQVYNEGQICINDDIILGIFTFDIVRIDFLKENGLMVFSLKEYSLDSNSYLFTEYYASSDVTELYIPEVYEFVNLNDPSFSLKLNLKDEILNPSAELIQKFDAFFS